MASTTIKYTPRLEAHVPVSGIYPAHTRIKTRILTGNDLQNSQFFCTLWDRDFAKRLAIIVKDNSLQVFVSADGSTFDQVFFTSVQINTVYDVEISVANSGWSGTVNGTPLTGFSKSGSFNGHSAGVLIIGGTQDGQSSTFSRPNGDATVMSFSIEDGDTNEVLQSYIFDGDQTTFPDKIGGSPATAHFGVPVDFTYDDVAKEYTKGATTYDASSASIDPTLSTPPVGNSKPVISLSKTSETIQVGGSFTFPTVSFSDAEDGVIASENVTRTGSADVNTAGDYVFYYNGVDSQGLAATEKTFTVQVESVTNTPTPAGIVNKPRELILLWGQSNMVGIAQAEAEDRVYDKIVGRVYQVGQDNRTLRAAENPLDHFGTYNTMGMWLEAINDLRGDYILIPAGRDGAALANTDVINNFNVVTNGGLYQQMLAQIQHAESYNDGNVITRVVVNIGETDANTNKTATFKQAMLDVRSDLIANTSMTEKTQWVFVSIKGSTTPANVPIINGLLQELATELPNADYVDTTDQVLFDTYHYDSASLRNIGRRVNSKFLNSSEINDSDNSISNITVETPLGSTVGVTAQYTGSANPVVYDSINDDFVVDQTTGVVKSNVTFSGDDTGVEIVVRATDTVTGRRADLIIPVSIVVPATITLSGTSSFVEGEVVSFSYKDYKNDISTKANPVVTLTEKLPDGSPLTPFSMNVPVTLAKSTDSAGVGSFTLPALPTNSQSTTETIRFGEFIIDLPDSLV